MFQKKVNLYIGFISVLILILTNLSIADTIILKDGTVLQGTLKSSTEFMVMFEVEGEVKEIKVNNIASITFTPRAEPVAEVATEVTTPVITAASATTAGAVTIPVNTKLTAKTGEDISTSGHQQGSKVSAILELDIIINDQVVVPKGAAIYGVVTESIGGRRVGNQKIMMSFNEIVINGKAVPIVTDPVGAEGGRGNAAKIVGASTIIGAAAGSAGKGAAVGAGIALLAGGKHIQIPKGTLFDLVIKHEVKAE